MFFLKHSRCFARFNDWIHTKFDVWNLGRETNGRLGLNCSLTLMRLSWVIFLIQISFICEIIWLFSRSRFLCSRKCNVCVQREVYNWVFGSSFHYTYVFDWTCQSSWEFFGIFGMFIESSRQWGNARHAFLFIFVLLWFLIREKFLSHWPDLSHGKNA